jgi:hypothetical protein
MTRGTQIIRRGLGTALAVLVMASIGVRSTRVAAFVLDDFTDGVVTKTGRGLEQKTKGSTACDDGRALRGVLGGTRQVVLKCDTEACSAAIDPAVKGLSYASSGRADGALELIYNAGGRGLRKNLSSVQGISVAVDADASSVPYTVTLTLRDSSTRSATTTKWITRSGAQQIDLLFRPSSSVSMRRIDQVRLVIDPPAAADLVVRRIETLASGKRGRRP